MSNSNAGRWQEFKVWLGAYPVQAVVIFIGINFIGVFVGEIVAGFAGDFVGFLVRGLFLAAAIAAGIAFLSRRWEMRR